MENQYFSRWYDKDPVLSMSMRTLASSNDEKQIAVALNLIKVIIEHNIQDNQYENVEDIMTAVEEGRIQRGYCRWYDIDSTVRTAIQMLEKCAPETKKKVALDMAQIVIEKIIQDDDKEELEKEEQQAQEPKTPSREFEGKVIDLDLDEILKNENE
ncbi:MAG: hypothetical protein IJD57_07730 [Candidatus Gastranaerophilales bacterium]|nr:hypothetical protein [Candidatus Gastranaerophilales bacterium]